MPSLHHLGQIFLCAHQIIGRYGLVDFEFPEHLVVRVSGGLDRLIGGLTGFSGDFDDGAAGFAGGRGDGDGDCEGVV